MRKLPFARFECRLFAALAAVDGLVVTGPTGTNVNDVAIGIVDMPISPSSHF